MKFLSFRLGAIAIPLILILWLLFCIFIAVIGDSKYALHNFLGTVWLDLFGLLLLPTSCCSVQIDKQGVKKVFLGFSWHRMAWDDIRFIGFFNTHDFTVRYKYLYFSKRILTEEEIKNETVRNQKDIIFVQYSDKLIKWVAECIPERLKDRFERNCA